MAATTPNMSPFKSSHHASSSSTSSTYLEVPGPKRRHDTTHGSATPFMTTTHSAAMSRTSSYSAAPSPVGAPSSTAASSATSLASGSRSGGSGSVTPLAQRSRASLGPRPHQHSNHHHLAPSRQGSQTSMQSGNGNSMAAGSNGPHALSRLRNVLGINKHATFLVKLTIHELNNIPLVDGGGGGGGGFSVHWKFRGGKGHDELRAKSSRSDLKAAAEQVVASASAQGPSSAGDRAAHKHGLGSKHRAARMLQQHSQQAKLLGGGIGSNGSNGGSASGASTPAPQQPRSSLDSSPLRKHFEAEDADEIAADAEEVGGVPPALEPGTGAGEAEAEEEQGAHVLFPRNSKSSSASPSEGSGASMPASMNGTPLRTKKDSKSSIGTALTFATTATSSTTNSTSSSSSAGRGAGGAILSDSPLRQPSILQSGPEDQDADSLVLLPGLPRAASPSSLHAPLPSQGIDGLPTRRSPALTDETLSEPDTPPRAPTPPRMSSLSTEFGRPMKGKGKSRSADHASHRSDSRSLNGISVAPSDGEESSIEYPAASNMHRQGDTPIRPVRDNRVEWDLPVAQLVKIDVNSRSRGGKRGSGASSPAPSRLPFHDSNLEHEESYTAPGMLGAGPKSESGLKLQVFQYPAGVSDEHSKKERLSFGVCNLDLAEYACEEAKMGRGGITRRYLLKNARTNATIKVSVPGLGLSCSISVELICVSFAAHDRARTSLWRADIHNVSRSGSGRPPRPLVLIFCLLL